MDDRELVSAEQGMEILNRRAASFHIVTISRVKGALSQDIVRQALDLLQRRHPRLNSRIVGSLDSLRFVSGAIKIPLRVHKLSNEQWQEVVVEELNQGIESDKGLLRTVLVYSDASNYLITTLHHAIADGLSSVQLHSEILTYCNRIASGEIITQVISLPALPPLPELLPKSIKGLKGAKNHIFFLLQLTVQQIWHRPKTLGFEECVPIESRRCGLVHRQLDTELTQQLVDLCRKEKTTVQGALCAAMMFAAARKITGEKMTAVRVSCRSYVDLHRRLQPVISDENMGVLASGVISFHTIKTNTSFWDLGRDVKQELEANLEREDIFSPVVMFRKIIESFLTRPNQVPVTVAISNIGRVNIPPVYGSFEIEEISFAPAQAVFGGVFAVAVSTFEGKMLLNFMFSEPSISQKAMEELANKAISCLVECLLLENHVNSKSFTRAKA